MRLHFVPGLIIANGAWLCLILLPPVVFGQSDFDTLLKRIPGQANAIVAMEVDALYRSPMAMEKKWKEKFSTNWNEQPILIPPEAKRIVLASHLDPLNNLRPDWEIGVMELAEPMSMNSIARAEGGYVDSIDGAPAVWTPSHAYFIQLEKLTLGLLYPDDRQAVSRWLTFARKSDRIVVSPYLQTAANRAGLDGQIIMALDLANVVQPHRLDRALKELPVFKGKKANFPAIADAVSSLKGVTLVLGIQSQAYAEVRVDFGQNIEILRPYAKELVLNVMDRVGASVAEPKNWTTTVEEQAIVFKGLLTEKSMRRISGLLELPTSKFSTLSKEASGEDDPAKATIEASKRYFGALQKLIADVTEGLKTPGNSTLWFERSSRKIDAMPVLHVDDQLLAFGSWVSKSMRQMAEGVRGVTRQQSVAQTQVYGNYSDVGSYGGSGYYRDASSVSNTLNEQARASASTVRTTGMKDINNGLADVRRNMTKKYGVEF